MMISTKGRYALRLMIDIASQGQDVKTPLREVSERQGISVKYLEQLVVPLISAGLIYSVRGAHGGYVLSRPAEEISTGEILRASEGGYAPVACLEENAAICPRRNECTTFDFWTGLENVIDDYLNGIKLSDLVDHSKTDCQDKLC